MNIVIVINSIIPVVKYGGTQRVIYSLGKELSKLGHDVTFLAAKGSYSDFAKVIDINPEKPILKQIPEYADVVHFNAPYNLKEFDKPYVVTIHGNRISGDIDKNSVFVSKNHATRFGCSSYVYNGLDWDEYGKPTLDKDRKGYHFLANAAWRVKNVRGAINVVKKLDNERLNVLGGVRFNFKMGLRFTFSPKIRFYGMVDNLKKREIIEKSKGLIFPVKWHEPFGLAIIESLYYGSPVFGTPYGSLPELIDDSVGFLTNNQNQMIDFLKNNQSYSSKLCNEYATDKFNSKVMALEYLKKYEEVIKGNPLNTNIIDMQRNQREGLEWIM